MNKKIEKFFENKYTPSTTFLNNINTKIFIYGTGSVAQSVFQVLISNNIAVSGFLNHLVFSSPFLNGVPIFPSKDAKDAIVILGIHNREVEIPLIQEKLLDYGVQRIITLIELYDFFSEELGTRFWLTNRNYYYSFKPLIDAVAELWTDKVSKSLYESIVEFRITGNYKILPKPDLVQQYFPADIPSWQTPLRFVDCGAFDGDTLQNFQSANIAIEALVAFEPDEKNFYKLTQYIQANENYVPQVNLYPCGVFSSTQKLPFTNEMGEASAIGGDSIIQCVSLDDAIPTFKPNLIKMDIEGAEVEALLGAKNIISRFRPGLAVSVYHHPEHLWKIPLLVKKLVLGDYQYFLRSHAFNDFELVFYAVPI